MPFRTSIAQWLLDGGPEITHQLLAQSGNTNIVIPASGTNFWPGRPRAGYVRIKQSTLNLNATVNIRSIVATDGNNIANIYPGDLNASGNNQYIDQSFLFVYDWGVANISFNCVTANNTATFDVEVIGTR